MTVKRVRIILGVTAIAIAGCGSGIGQTQSEWSRIVSNCREVGTETDLWSLRDTVREARSYGYSRDEVVGVAYRSCSNSCWDHQCVVTCSDCARAIVDLEY